MVQRPDLVMYRPLQRHRLLRADRPPAGTGQRLHSVRLESTRGHLILSSAVALLLGLLLFIVYWLDHPFENQLGITSAPFKQTLYVFDAIDRGT